MWSLGDRRASAQILVEDPRVELVSATGSVRMGRKVGPRVAHRFGRSLLELGGNNAAIVAPSADLDLVLRRRRVLGRGHGGSALHDVEAIVRPFVDRRGVRRQDGRGVRTLTIGSPVWTSTCSWVRWSARARSSRWSRQARDGPGRWRPGPGAAVIACSRRSGQDAFYVEPAVVRMPSQTEVVHEETFAPILYVVYYDASSMRRSSSTTRCRRGCRRRCSRTIWARRRVSCRRRSGLRDRECEHRYLGRGDRWRVRWQQGDRWRTRVRNRLVEGLHAPGDEHGQLLR